MQISSINDRQSDQFSHAEMGLLRLTEEFVRDTVTVQAPVWEAQRRVGLEAIQASAQFGLTGIQVPTQWGGLGLSFQCKAAVADLLAQGDFGFSMSLINTHNVAAKLAHDARDSVASHYVADLLAARRIGCTALTEPGAGSDFAAITTIAVPCVDGWRINGHKAWITNASCADVIVLYAQTQAGSGARGIAGFVIDAQRSGFVRAPAYAMAGQHSIGAGGFELNDYLADEQEMILPPGQAFRSALTSINGARIYVAAMCCGMLHSALATARSYGLTRTTFGSPLHGHQGWRWNLAEAAAQLDAARALVREAAVLIDNNSDAQIPAAKAKVFATRMAEQHLGPMMQAMGAEGLREQYPLARHLIGVRMAGFVDGSTEMLLERIARDLAGPTP